MGLGNLAVVLAKKGCNVSRLDLGGRFGDEGVKILAEALKVNRSLRTITISFSENLTEVGGHAILSAVDGTESWESATRGNNVLRSVYISEGPNVSISKDLILKLEDITNVDPHLTCQNKVWRYIDNHMEELPQVGLKSKLMPQAISFVHKNGGLDASFRLIRSWNVEELFANPTPERVRLKEIEQENKMLRDFLENEKNSNYTLRQENRYLRFLYEKREKAECCWTPLRKACELWKVFIDLLKEL